MRDSGWFKSSYSGGGTDNCVEVRFTDLGVHVRDTKNRAAGTLRLPPATWGALIRTLA